MYMENFLEITERIFEPIVAKYNLTIEQKDSNTILLKGQGYALEITISREGVSVFYYTNNGNNETLQYDIDSYISSHFTSEDRSGIGTPEIIRDIIIAQLKVVASGLSNHFKPLLAGDKEWLKDYSKSAYAQSPRIL
jgi:hypothetical protein